MSEHTERDADTPAETETNEPADPSGEAGAGMTEGPGGSSEPQVSRDPTPASRAPDPGAGKPEPGWYPDPDSGDGEVLRYWDGSTWTSHRSAPEGGAQAGTVPPPANAATPADQFRTTLIPDDERRNILSQQIQASAVRGLRVENQDRYQAILVEGQPVNHVLHAILTIATCFLWGIVWAVLAATGGEKRHLITVDEYGNVTHQRLGKA